MLALARYTLKGPFQAAGVVGLLAVLAVFTLPLAGLSLVTMTVTMMASIFAVVLVGLIILTQGIGEGLKVIACSALVAMLAAWIAFKSPGQGISMVVTNWLPVIILAQVLRASRSMSFTVLAGVAVGLLTIALQALFWTEMQQAFLAELMLRADGVEIDPEEKQQYEQAVRVLMVFFAPLLYLTSMLILLCSRWIQSKLSESPEFGREFQALSLGKPAALVALVTLSLGLWLQLGWIASIAFLVIIAFMFQGIAVVHALLSARKQAFPLLVLYYLLLVFTLQITGVLTSIAGIIDNWLGFRGKPQNPAV